MAVGEWLGVGLATAYLVIGAPLGIKRRRRKERERRMQWIEGIKRDHPFPGEPGYQKRRP